MYIAKSTIKSNLWHQCAICHKTYSHKNNLKRHIRSFHENKTYNCAICDGTFKRKGYLKRHLMKQHPDVSPIKATKSFETISVSTQTRRTVLHKMAAVAHKHCNTSPRKFKEQGCGSPLISTSSSTSPILWGNLHLPPQPPAIVEEYHTRSISPVHQLSESVVEPTHLHMDEDPLPTDLSSLVVQDFFQDLDSLNLDFSDFM